MNEDRLASARKVYERLVTGATSQKTRSLKALWEALIWMYETDAPDFAIASVGRASEDRGGPKTQSIRNAAHFRELIDAVAAAAAKPTRKIVERRSAEESALTTIDNLQHRQLIALKLAELSALKNENAALRKSISHLSIGERTDYERKPAATLEGPARRPVVPESAKTVIRTMMSDDWIEERGWRVGNDGSITGPDGIEVMPAGAYAALIGLIADPID